MSITLSQFKSYLRSEVEAAGGVRALGRVLDVPPERISEVLRSPVGRPGHRLLKSMRFRKVSAIFYERAK